MYKISFLLPVVFMACSGAAPENNDKGPQAREVNTDTIKNMEKPSLHSFTVKDITGNDFSFSSLKGRKIMIVNTASECGLTPQYENLEKVYTMYKDSGFVIVGFPANNFGAQEPGSNAEIAAFCSAKFNVTFPMMEKVSVKDENVAEIYQWLTQKEKNGVADVDIKWNFQKFLIDEEGHFVKTVEPNILPDDPSVIAWITGK